jgi:hypothetical protein
VDVGGVAMMDDAKLAAQALIDAQRILEEYLLPRPRTNERTILDRLVEVLDRPSLTVAVRRLQRGEQFNPVSRTICVVVHPQEVS